MNLLNPVEFDARYLQANDTVAKAITARDPTRVHRPGGW
jgi:hypothetical protein